MKRIDLAASQTSVSSILPTVRDVLLTLGDVLYDVPVLTFVHVDGALEDRIHL